MACVILILIFLIKFVPDFAGISLGSNPISNLHWSYYVLAFIGVLFYICTLYGNVKGCSFEEWRAASNAVTRAAQALIYTIIILNIYGSTIIINAQTNVTVTGAVIALFIGMYVKLFENTVTGIAKKINYVLSSEPSNLNKLWSEYEKIKKDLDATCEKLIERNSKEPDKYQEELTSIITQIEINTCNLKKIKCSIAENELEKAKNLMLEVETGIRIIKLKYGLCTLS